MQPAAAVVRVAQPAEQAEGATTELHATMPPTASIGFKWLDASGQPAPLPRAPAAEEPGAAAGRDGEAAAAEAATRPQVTASHDALVSISEGLVQTSHALVLRSAADSSPLATVEARQLVDT